MREPPECETVVTSFAVEIDRLPPEVTPVVIALCVDIVGPRVRSSIYLAANLDGRRRSPVEATNVHFDGETITGDTLDASLFFEVGR